MTTTVAYRWDTTTEMGIFTREREDGSTYKEYQHQPLNREGRRILKLSAKDKKKIARELGSKKRKKSA